MLLSLAIAAGSVLAVAAPEVVRADGNVQFIDRSGGAPPPTAAQLRHVVPYITDDAARDSIAGSLGLAEVAGKPLHSKFVEDAATAARLASVALFNGDFDHMVSGDTISIHGQQLNPTIAVNPVDQSIVVAIAQNTSSVSGNGLDCTVYLSRDGGAGYDYAFDLAYYFQTTTPSCGSPKAVFSPDGLYLYVSYLELGATFPGSLIATHVYDGFSFVHYGGLVFNYGSTSLDSTSIAVHAFDAGGGGDATYVVFTNFYGATGCSIEELTFTNYLANYAFHTLASLNNCTGSFPTGRLLQGPSVAAGPGSQVLACWFDAGVDGYSTDFQLAPPAPPLAVELLNKFNIACRSSNDRGVNWAGDFVPPESVNPPDYTKWIYAAKDVSSEVPYWLGPNASYFHIGASQFPSVAIDHLGNAHVAFSYSLPTNRFKSDATNIAYSQSVDPIPTGLLPTIYSKWSAKTIVATGAGAQLFPAVVAQRVLESAKPYIYVAWLDTAASAKLGVANANIIYDARYRLSTADGKGFGKTVIAADHASVSDQATVGTRLGVAASTGIFHFAWTDNRFATSPGIARRHIFAERF